MSPRLPRITASQAAQALEKAGFRLVRQTGSHRIYRDEDFRRVTLPVHAGKILHPKLLRSVLIDANLTAEELRKLLT